MSANDWLADRIEAEWYAHPATPPLERRHGCLTRLVGLIQEALDMTTLWHEPDTCKHGREAQACGLCELGTPTLAPYVAGSATSHGAAAQIVSEAPKLRERVFAYIEAHEGVTDEQIASGTGLNPSTVRPRRVELARAGRIEVGGYSRTASGRKAQAWIASAPSGK